MELLVGRARAAPAPERYAKGRRAQLPNSWKLGAAHRTHRLPAAAGAEGGGAGQGCGAAAAAPQTARWHTPPQRGPLQSRRTQRRGFAGKATPHFQRKKKHRMCLNGQLECKLTPAACLHSWRAGSPLTRAVQGIKDGRIQQALAAGGAPQLAENVCSSGAYTGAGTHAGVVERQPEGTGLLVPGQWGGTPATREQRSNHADRGLTLARQARPLGEGCAVEDGRALQDHVCRPWHACRPPAAAAAAAAAAPVTARDRVVRRDSTGSSACGCSCSRTGCGKGRLASRVASRLRHSCRLCWLVLRDHRRPGGCLTLTAAGPHFHLFC